MATLFLLLSLLYTFARYRYDNAKGHRATGPQLYDYLVVLVLVGIAAVLAA
jgi:hypothetical protein